MVCGLDYLFIAPEACALSIAVPVGFELDDLQAPIAGCGGGNAVNPPGPAADDDGPGRQEVNILNHGLGVWEVP